MREHPGVVQRVRMVGCHLEHPAVQLLRLDELLVFLKHDGERHRLFERQLARWRFGLLRLTYFVGLEVVLEMNLCIERPIRLLRPVFEVDLGKRQSYRL